MATQKPQSALETWRERLEFLQKQLAIISDPAQRFELKKQIEECQQKINEFEEKKQTYRWAVLLVVLASLIGIGLYYKTNQSSIKLTGGEVRDETQQSSIKITSGETRLFTGDNVTLEKAFTNFSQGNYQEAKNLFKNYNDAQRTPPEPDIKIFQYNAEAREKTQNNKQKSWKIAIILSGLNKERSQAHLRGISEAQTQFNKLRRLQEKSLIEILIVDNNQPNSTSLQFVGENLTQYPNLLAVIGSYTSTNTEKILNLYQMKKIPLLSASATATILENDYFFRLPPTNRKSSEILSHYLESKLGNIKNRQKGIVIWNTDDLFSKSWKEDFEFYMGKEIWQAEIQVSSSEITSDLNDALEEYFTEQNIEDNKIKYALLALNYRQNDIAKKIGELNAKLPEKLQLILLTGDTLYEQGNETIDNLVLVVPWFSDTPWGKKMEERWGGRVNWRTAMNYNALQAILESLKRLERKKIQPTKEGIWQELRSPDFQINEKYTSGENLYFDRKQNSNQKPRLIKTCIKEQKADFCPIFLD